MVDKLLQIFLQEPEKNIILEIEQVDFCVRQSSNCTLPCWMCLLFIKIGRNEEEGVE